MPPVLDDYFSLRRLIKILCRRRIGDARKARREKFIASVVRNKLETTRSDLAELLPPRRLWKKFRPRKIERRTSKDAPSALLSSMIRWVYREVTRPQRRYQWADKLSIFLDDIRTTALNWSTNSSIGAITPVPIEKKQTTKESAKRKYRIISRLSPKDSLICSGYAAYLRDYIDPTASSSNFAFRSSPSKGQPPPQHHDTIAHIRALNSKNPSNEIWCAEADIQCFFDAISHHTLQAALINCLSTSKIYYNRNGEVTQSTAIDQRLTLYVNNFLDSYDYESAESSVRSSCAIPGLADAIFPKPRNAIESMGVPNIGDKIGIPQGTALSCVLANIIMAPADAILDAHIQAFSSRNESIYLRFCDDIIIASRDKDLCTSMMNAYLSTLHYLRLPFHKPEEVVQYNSPTRPSSEAHPFWSKKSKLPYLWSCDRKPKSVPWFSFVGYEVHRESNQVRVRQKSIENELDKQYKVYKDIALQITKYYQTPSNTTKPQLSHQDIQKIRRRTMRHLLSIGVGYPKCWTTVPSRHGVSWSTGFKAIQTSQQGSSPIALDVPFRRLDRGRSRILRALHDSLHRIRRKYQRHVSKQTQASGNTRTSKKKEPFLLRYDGYSFSYYRQFR